MVGEDVDPLKEDRIGAAEVVEFVLLLVAEHPFGVAAGEFDFGVADAIGGGLVAELAVVLGAAEFEIPMVMIEGEDLIGEAGPVEVAERKVGVEVLGIGFEGAVVALAGVVPAALICPAESILEVALATWVAGGAVEPVTAREEKGCQEKPQDPQAASSAHRWVQGGDGGRAAHVGKLTGMGMDFKQRLRLSALEWVERGDWGSGRDWLFVWVKRPNFVRGCC
jgi:hypothetical protein